MGKYDENLRGWGPLFWGLGVYCALLLLFHGPVGESLDKLSLRVSFRVRELLGRAPQPDRRLKVIELDPRDPLGAGDYADLFSFLLQDQKAARVYTNKIFHYRFEFDPNEARLWSVLQSSADRIISALELRPKSYHGPGAIPSSDEAAYSNEKWLMRLNESRLPVARDVEILGPHPSLGAWLKNVGHANVGNREGYFPAIVRVNADYASSHFALLGGGSVETSLPIDSEGYLLVNFPKLEDVPRIDYRSRLLPRLLENKAPLIHPEDIVFVVFRSPSAAKEPTPIGELDVSDITLSVIDNRLREDWLRPVGVRSGWMFLGILIATIASVFLSLRLLWTVIVAGSLGFALVGASSLILGGWVLPWLSATSAYFLAGLLFIYRSYRAEAIQVRKFRSALEGLVDPQKLSRLLDRPRNLRLAPSRQEMSVLFVDMVGFSKSAETMDPTDLFQSLKERLREMVEIVHRHGGIVDKSLGDGLLCFFGYEYDGKQDHNHATAAVECALELQRNAIARSVAGQSTHPLRIGVNTAEVVIGDLGGDSRLDFSLLGHGVNFAQRLETACEPFRILIGPNTFKKWSVPSYAPYSVHRREVQIKHHDEVFEAYEIQIEQGEGVSQAVSFYSQQEKKKRETARKSVVGIVELSTASVTGEIVNLSDGGASVRSASYFGQGTRLRVRFDESTECQMEVRWGSPSTEGYVHGLRFLDPSDAKRVWSKMKKAG